MSRIAIALSVILSVVSVARADLIEITTDTTIDSGNAGTYENQDIIVRGCTVTINVPLALNSLTVERNASNAPGIVTHAAALEAGLQLTVATDVTVQGADDTLVASRIDARGRGYPAGEGPGAGQGAYGSGGGYGGAGGDGYSGQPGGGTYGSVTQPIDMGSGGKFAAGGVVRLTVQGVLTVNAGGVINSDGTGGDAGGGGSGGSVWITCGELQGDGFVTASGGTGLPWSGGGGGGRVAIYTCDQQMNPAQITATGGTGGQNGQPGTVLFASPWITITAQPAGGIAPIGDPVTLSIVATGQGALQYQWRKDGLNLTEDPPHLTGTQTATLYIDAAVYEDQDDYDVWLTDDCGNFVSDAAHLIVPPPGDMNCDGTVDFADINPFVLYLSNYGVWLQTYVNCPPDIGDINGDGSYGDPPDFGDINPFVALFSGGG
jgi:hypothetical protein